MGKQRCNTRNLRMARAENVQEFRGIAGYYRQYIKQFSDKMKPLNERLILNDFQWTKEEEEAFKKIKESHRKNQILIIHDPEKADIATCRHIQLCNRS